MNREFILVPEAEFRELKTAVDRVAQLYAAIEALSGRMTVPLPDTPSPGASVAPPFRQQVTPARKPPSTATSKNADGQYQINRGFGWADLVAQEVNKDEFSIDEAGEILLPLIQNPAERWRDGMRRSLRNDSRFAQVPDDVNRFRRVLSQPAGAEGEREVGTSDEGGRGMPLADREMIWGSSDHSNANGHRSAFGEDDNR